MKLNIIVFTTLSALTLQLPCLAEYNFTSVYRNKAQQVADRYIDYVKNKLNDGTVTQNQAQSIINSINYGLNWADEICSTSDKTTCEKALYEIHKELQSAYTNSLFNAQSKTSER